MMKLQKITAVSGKTMLFGLLGLLLVHGHAGAAVSSPKAKAAPAKATVGEKYAVLNPRADMPPIDAKALAPRLATLQGKTVYVYGLDFRMNPGDEIMLMIARGLAKAVPGIKVVYLSDRYADATTDTVVPVLRIAKEQVDTDNWKTFKEAEKADAVVTGLGF
jgi:hypothetical protein